MLIDYVLGQTSIIARVKIRSSTTGNGLTGLTNASSGLIIGTISDVEATTTAYTAAGSTIQTIATLGTYAAPTAGDCRFQQVDATNHPGIYEIQIANARFAVSNAKSLLVSITGASGALDCDAIIPLRSVNPYDAVRGGMTALPNTACTTNASLITSGAGTDQLTVSGGIASADAKKINAVSTSPVTTIAANVGTTQPVNFSGTGSTAYIKSDIEQVGGTTASPATTIPADIQTIKGQAVSCPAPVTVGAFVGNGAASIAADANGRVPIQVGTAAGQINSSSGKVPATVATGDGVDAASILAKLAALLGVDTTQFSAHALALAPATGGGSVTVAGYSTGQDPATLLLVNPANKLNTDANGRVAIQVGAAAGQINSSGGKIPATVASTDVTGNLPANVLQWLTKTPPTPPVDGVPVVDSHYQDGIADTLACQGGSTTTAILNASEPTSVDFSKQYIVFRTGACAGMPRLISSSSVSSNNVTVVVPAWDGGASPSSGDLYEIGGYGVVAGAGNVTVGGYATGQDPGSLVLANPSQKIATDSSGNVKVGGPFKVNAAAGFSFRMVQSSDNKTAYIGAANTITATRTVAGGTPGAVSGTITQVGSTNEYYFAGQAADFNGTEIHFAFVASGANPVYITVPTTP